MIEASKPGTKVRWAIPDGGMAEIITYKGEGFYLVKTIPEQRELIGSENDLLLEHEWRKKFNVRCGKCRACQNVEKTQKAVLRCCNHPFGHADDGVVAVWNRELADNPCETWKEPTA